MNYTMQDLRRIVIDPKSSREMLELALSLAYEQGRNVGIDEARDAAGLGKPVQPGVMHG